MKQAIEKPLGHRAYGSIPHLPGSKAGFADEFANPGHARIATLKPRDKHDHVVVQAKVDGTCVAVAKLEGKIVPLIRAGYRAEGSTYPQHHLFHHWAMQNEAAFLDMLNEGERVCGEWLAQAHGIRYVRDEPFIAFDIMAEHRRLIYKDFIDRIGGRFETPHLVHQGLPCSVEKATSDLFLSSPHGEIGPPEGAVWRIERKGDVDFLAKFVRHDFVPGAFFGADDVWNDIPWVQWAIDNLMPHLRYKP